MSSYDRTNTPADHVYDIGPTMRVYRESEDDRHPLYEVDVTSATDTQTVMVQAMRGAGGMACVWGVDADKVPCWERINDDVACKWLDAIEASLTNADE